MSAARAEDGRARAKTGQQPRLGLGPGERCGRGGRGKNGPHALGREENRPESRERIRNPFPIFQIHFSNDFQIKFEFDLNHSIQNFKCSSMNAQSCFYPYI
jgi:hypothetical protein